MDATVTKAEYVSKRVGRAWRGFVRQEVRATRWMIGHGMSPRVAAPILWIAKITVFAILLYAAFWLALVLAIAVAAAWMARSAYSDRESAEWAIGEQADHKESVFYDPINYSDTPDPRFDDE